MDPREKLADLAKERGTSLASLSRMLSRNPTYLQQYITKGSPKKLEEEDRGILAQFFGVEESELGGPKDKSYERHDDDKWVEAPRLEVDASAGPGAARSSTGRACSVQATFASTRAAET